MTCDEPSPGARGAAAMGGGLFMIARGAGGDGATTCAGWLTTAVAGLAGGVNRLCSIAGGEDP